MRRAQPVKPTLGGKLRQVWQLALRHPSLGQLGIHSVEAEDDDLLLKSFWRRTAAAGNRECGRRQYKKTSNHVRRIIEALSLERESRATMASRASYTEGCACAGHRLRRPSHRAGAWRCLGDTRVAVAYDRTSTIRACDARPPRF